MFLCTYSMISAYIHLLKTFVFFLYHYLIFMLTHSPPCPSTPLLALLVAHPLVHLFSISPTNPQLSSIPQVLEGMCKIIHSPTHSLIHSPTHLPIQSTLLPHPLIHNFSPFPQVLAGMSKIIRECWHQNPNVRLTALRVKKSLMKLAQEDAKNKVDIDYWGGKGCYLFSEDFLGGMLVCVDLYMVGHGCVSLLD